ncbi:MAG TPA: VWA domain-containing protein [Acidimicrobiia bacterium]|jgi:uncharacterized protein with von Willebrand factor type A (vWA) domain
MTSLETLVAFTHRLREEGVPVPSGMAGPIVAALDLVGLAQGEDAYHALRALTCSSVEQLAVFDRVFAEFFSDASPPALVVLADHRRNWQVRRSQEGLAGDGDRDGTRVTAGASAIERLGRRDFASLSAAEANEIRQLIAAMMWAPSRVASRRRHAGERGRPDLRRTMRRSIGPEADLLHLRFSERRMKRRPLLFIADVSGSMERYTEMLLYFAHAARGRLGRLEAFVFSTRLTRITRQLSRRDPSQAIAEVSAAVGDWSGGTKIGAAMEAFNREWSRRVGRGGPLAVIISDGWDRGEPDLLRREMARLKRSVHRVIWLNPLAGRPGFSPETRGMKAALSYVDDFLPAANLDDLSAVVDLLESVPA